MPTLLRMRASLSAPCFVRVNQHLTRLRLAEQVDQQRTLLALLGEMHPLGNGLDDRCRGVTATRLRVVEDPGRQRGDVRGHRGREEERLPPFGQQRQDASDVVDEAHVEHPVGFIENEEAQVLERDVALADEVEQASGVATSRSTPCWSASTCGRCSRRRRSRSGGSACSGHSRGSTRRSGWPVRASA